MNEDWEDFKKTVKPLEKNQQKFFIKEKIHLVDTTYKKNDLDKQSYEEIDLPGSQKREKLEKNILKQIFKGKIKISESLDLHGYSVNESKKMVFDFILKNHEKQNRLLIIISGKGKRLSVSDGWKGTGALRENLPQWLESKAFDNKILWFDTAPPDRGGNGAFLVYLKKSTK